MAFDNMLEGVVSYPERYKRIWDKLQDDISKEIMQYILNFRITLNIEYTKKAYELSIKYGEQYFDRNIIQISDEEVFVDGGGYKGETVLEFLKFANGKYKKVYYFEPDKKLYEEAKNNLSDKSGIIFLPFGIGKKEEELYFNSIGDESGYFSDTGNESIKVIKLDDVIKEKPTFIKLDIEGMEHDAIEGAKEIIKNYKPKLAISVYHKSSDIIDISEQISELRKDYQMYLRHYTKGCADTVMYFI